MRQDHREKIKKNAGGERFPEVLVYKFGIQNKINSVWRVAEEEVNLAISENWKQTK